MRPPGEILQFTSHSYESRLKLQTIIEFVGFGEIQGLDSFQVFTVIVADADVVVRMNEFSELREQIALLVGMVHRKKSVPRSRSREEGKKADFADLGVTGFMSTTACQLTVLAVAPPKRGLCVAEFFSCRISNNLHL